MEGNEINNAFESLLLKMESSIKLLNEEGKKAIEKENYAQARKVIEDATGLSSFREKVNGLFTEWRQMFPLENIQKPLIMGIILTTFWKHWQV